MARCFAWNNLQLPATETLSDNVSVAGATNS